MMSSKCFGCDKNISCVVRVVYIYIVASVNQQLLSGSELMMSTKCLGCDVHFLCGLCGLYLRHS